MKILFLGPLPPPVNGHSLAAKVFLDDLVLRNEVTAVDLSVDSKSDGSVTPDRLAAVFKVLRQVFRARRGQDVIYLTIAESITGNLKDLMIYAICHRSLGRVVIHLHGGTIKSELFDRYPLIRRINTAFIRRMGAVIISGRSHDDVFRDMIDARRIHVSENFAQDEMFVAERRIAAKFARTESLRVLFVSNMFLMKGYHELADAWMALDPAVRARIRLDFAGRFDSDANRERFLAKISGVAGVRYHGVVDSTQKRELFAEAHVFCLPSAFKEGQPISILEGYASGCVVAASGQPGIRDVFADGVNGIELEARSVPSLRAMFEKLTRTAPAELERIALANWRTASVRYRTASYNARLSAIVEGVGERKQQ